MNVRLQAGTLVVGPRGPTLQEVGLRAGRAAPDWSRRAGFPLSSRKPQAQPVGIRGGRGGREAQAGRGGAGWRPRGWWAVPSLPGLLAPGFGSGGDLRTVQK